MNLVMPRIRYKKGSFGRRLVELRKARGFTQTLLAEKIGSTQRIISHYETQAANPPLTIVVDLAQALRVSADELLGIKPVKADKLDAEEKRLWKKFRKIRTLPIKDQRAIIRMVNSLVSNGKKG